jgi:hypothetical protein
MTEIERLQQAGIRRLGSPKNGFRYRGGRDMNRILVHLAGGGVELPERRCDALLELLGSARRATLH